MLGRRAAVAAVTLAAAVTGGGVALAANHGSSGSSNQPATHATSKQYAGPRSMQGSHGSGNCPNMGGSSSSSNTSASL